MSAPAYGVVADDLTGAADAGVQFSLAGLAVELALDGRLSAGTDVVVLNTASRDMTAPDAERAATDACRRLEAAGVAAIFKKIDSTLRGHPGVEIAALLRGAAQHPWALVCPAFPEQGRSVVDGRLRVRGRTVAGPDVGALLSRQGAGNVGWLTREAVDRGAGEVAERLDALRSSGVEIVVADADCSAALATLVAGAATLDQAPLYAGSAGLAGAVAEALGRATTGPALVLVGSLQPEARQQAQRLAERPGWLRIEIDEETLVADEQVWNAWRRRAVAAASDRAPADGALVISPPAPDEPTPALAASAADRLGVLGRDLVGALEPAGVVVTGGETAESLLSHLGAHRCRLIGEIEPGVPVGRLAGGSADALPVVLKAGGFGTDDVLARACDALRLLSGESA
jgi:uncharacterized protein YgbK (DUF1537 family)